ncbi:LemA family protein [Candidatus Microgenomates bacterium]|jgi:LemA protein|nr:MAG: LemA family protein [Candidatus Microgenomates bacterium]
MLVFLAVLAIIALYFLSIYNRLVTLRTRIRASIQEIGNQLKRQAELIPNLVESVKGYMKHEKEIFKSLTDARKAIMEATSKNDPQMMVEASDMLTKTIGGFRALMESTPEIKASETVNRLMEELRDTADKVMYARRTLIDLSADYNVNVVTFPSNIVANIFGFKEEKGLVTPMEGAHVEVKSAETETPKVSL